ncbi:MAG: hypothetical protein C0403_07730 [Desulfobacterium sp.]|nr:hypothetical protein [Desulfobacterium sp.]
MIEFIYQTLAQFGFRHPLHPAITHIPMGMVMGGFLFALASFVLKKDELAKTAHYCYTLALIFVLPTMLLGYMDWQYKFDAEWNNLILAKIVLAFVFSGLLFGAFFVGKNNGVPIQKKLILYGICLAAATGLGFLGGEIQYG